MQTLLATAAGLGIVTGVAHSVLGELLIFRKLRTGTLVPAHGAPPLQSRNVRILWATWHLATVFGWAFAANAVGSLLVLVGTRGRHPGWLALAAVAVLTWAALGGA